MLYLILAILSSQISKKIVSFSWVDFFSENIFSFVGNSQLFDILLAILAIPIMRKPLLTI